MPERMKQTPQDPEPREHLLREIEQLARRALFGTISETLEGRPASPPEYVFSAFPIPKGLCPPAQTSEELRQWFFNNYSPLTKALSPRN